MTGHLRYLEACGAVRRAGRVVKAEALAAEWQAVDAVKAAQEPAVAAAFADLMREQKAAALEAWASADVKATPVLLDLSAWVSRIADLFGPVLSAVLSEGFATGALRSGAVDLAFRLTPGAEAALAEGVALVQGTTAVTRDRLARIVADGLERGDTADAIGRAIARQFDDWTDARAQLVGRTESTRVFEAGQVEAYGEAGIESKRWLSQRDGRVRPAHDAIDGEEVPVGDAFSNGLQYPSEPGCRCSTLPVTAPPKALTRKQRRDAHIRARYRATKGQGSQYQRAEIVHAEGFEGEPYAIGPETLLDIAGRKG